MTAEGSGLIPDQGTKIPQALRAAKKKKKKYNPGKTNLVMSIQLCSWLWCLRSKESICNAGDAGRQGVDPWVDPWRRK